MQNAPYFFECAHKYLKPDGVIAITEYCVMTTGISDPIWLEFRNREFNLYKRIQSHPQVSFEIPILLQKRGFKNITSKFCQVSPATVNKNHFYDLVDVCADLYSSLDPLGWTKEFVAQIHNWSKNERDNPISDPAMWLTQTSAEK